MLIQSQVGGLTDILFSCEITLSNLGLPNEKKKINVTSPHASTKYRD